jgi:capsular polysaccharide export protein
VPVWQVEDGFVRSVGLGADSAPPYSVVVDRHGIYFDPNQPSELEEILQHAPFPPELLARATALMETLVARRISKYNTGGAARPLPAPLGRRVVLVPGQVSDDRSVLLGGAGIRDNLTLLARVREAAPDAYVVYKPHPDVDAGQRAGAVPDDAALAHANLVLRDVAMPALLAQVDEVHTLTSLAGFEALLRGRRVVVFGQPFYAGWGLTEDHAPLPRRSRRLTLAELVAGTLLLYARYLDPVTLLPCPAEVLLARLDDPTLWRPGPRILLRRAWGRLRHLVGAAPG